MDYIALNKGEIIVSSSTTATDDIANINLAPDPNLELIRDLHHYLENDYTDARDAGDEEQCFHISEMIRALTEEPWAYESSIQNRDRKIVDWLEGHPHIGANMLYNLFRRDPYHEGDTLRSMVLAELGESEQYSSFTNEA